MVLEALQQRPSFSDATLQERSTSFSPLVFATTFYGLDPPVVPNYRPATPLMTAVEQLFRLSQTCAKCLVQKQGSDDNLKATHSHILFILTKLVEFANTRPDINLDLSLVPSSWLEDVLDCLDMEVCGRTSIRHFRSFLPRVLTSRCLTVAYPSSLPFIARLDCY